MLIGQLPCFMIKGMDFLQTYETLATTLYANGGLIKFSRDSTVLACQAMTHTLNPLREPSIHKGISISPISLITYGKILYSDILSDWDPEDTEVLQTLGELKLLQEHQIPLMVYKMRTAFGVDQLQSIANTICEDPKKASFKIYFHNVPDTDSPECRLQLLELHLIPNDAGQILLYMTAHWGSMELLKHWFIAGHVVYRLGVGIARGLRELTEKSIVPGRLTTFTNFLYLDTSDEAVAQLVEMQKTSYLQRALIYKDAAKWNIDKSVHMRFAACRKLKEKRAEKTAKDAQSTTEVLHKQTRKPKPPKKKEVIRKPRRNGNGKK